MKNLIFALIIYISINSDCIKNAEVIDNFYLKGNIIEQGSELGNEKFNITIETNNSDQEKLILKISYMDSNTENPLIGASLDKVCKIHKAKNRFKIKKLLGVSNKDGIITISKKEKNISYFSITFPGFAPRIFNYVDFIKCDK